MNEAANEATYRDEISASFLRASVTVGNGVPSFLARARICSMDRPKIAAARVADAPLAISVFSRSVSLSVQGLFRGMAQLAALRLNFTTLTIPYRAASAASLRSFSRLA